ncbi:HNH endonuclease [Streptomyces sp. NPDC050264]|uniref:HNH endonuclease n=1 Tax=Streptomyces sp. NPDC050264 TaxID=3155038 RepID=UPI003432F261
MDHIEPEAAGGSDRVSNLTLCCGSCDHRYDRNRHGLPKSHMLDPLRVGEAMDSVRIVRCHGVVQVMTGTGRGRCSRTRATAGPGRYRGTHRGRVAVRASGPTGSRPLMATSTPRTRTFTFCNVEMGTSTRSGVKSGVTEPSWPCVSC